MRVMRHMNPRGPCGTGAIGACAPRPWLHDAREARCEHTRAGPKHLRRRLCRPLQAVGRRGGRARGRDLRAVAGVVIGPVVGAEGRGEAGDGVGGEAAELEVFVSAVVQRSNHRQRCGSRLRGQGGTGRAPYTQCKPRTRPTMSSRVASVGAVGRRAVARPTRGRR